MCAPNTRRICLRCGREFFSTGPGNRLCHRCNKANRRDVSARVARVGGCTERRGTGRSKDI
jgi:hypothetical protein